MDLFNDFKKMIARELGALELNGSQGDERELCVKGWPTALSIYFTEAYGEVEIGHLFDHEGDYAKLSDEQVAELERFIADAFDWEPTESDDEPDGMDIRKMRLEDGY